MWSPSGPVWHVGLSSRRLVRARRAGRWGTGGMGFDQVDCEPAEGEAPWKAPVAALASLFGRERARAPVVRGVLSGQFVRWQLIPWQAELAGRDEFAAYARACFAEAFGAAVADWTIVPALQPPGRPVPACAVDAGLVEALQAACAAAGARLHVVTPYFASAADHWRKTIGGGTAWLGLIEPDCVSLGLLREGAWLALHTRRVQGDGAEQLPGMMAQLSMSVPLSGVRPALYLAGDAAPAADRVGMPFVWLDPAMKPSPGIAAWRLALGR